METNYSNGKVGFYLLVAAFVFTAAIGGIVVSAEEKPRVHLYKALDPPPMLAKGVKASENPSAAHRRVVTRPKDGSIHMDVGHNSVKADLSSDTPYAYDKDELCYFSKGDMYVRSYDSKVLTTPGYFMYRPAGAVTHRIKVISDAVTVCAFAPARFDDWGHKISAEDIIKIGQEPEYPEAVFLNMHDVEPLVTLGVGHKSGENPIVRQVFSKQKNRFVTMDASHITYKAGFNSGPISNSNDEICWLESGKIEMRNDGVKELMSAGDFLWRPAGAVTESATVLEDSVSICFSAVAQSQSVGYLSNAKK